MENSDSNKTKHNKFNLLRDEVENIDIFEDKTHDNVANSMAELIKVEKGGITIGLEGSWGSGKSTVISILKEKLSKISSIKLIQFDAWAHQGDPLRRIFLEALIDEIKGSDNDSKLETIQKKISNREKTIKIKTTRSVTNLGKILSLATFFIPIGLVLMSLVKNLGFSLEGQPHFLFILSLLLSSMPIIVIFGNLFRLTFHKIIKKDIKVFESENWAFLQDDSSQDITQEVSEEEERSSIEFEKYFNDILKLFFAEQSEEARLIIVIDNLDRVASKDALTIWSTLQTFLQQRSNIRNKDWFKKIWIIIPYDPDGLSSLWTSNENVSDEKNNNEVAKAFFDKNFQLRFEVPMPVFSGWTNFAERMTDKALHGWSKMEKKDALNVLILTMEDLNDIPTPREIKNYINQIALLAYQYSEDIPISSIGYYAIMRQMKFISKRNIREKLVSGEMPESKHLNFLPASCRKDIAGLVFGVNPEKGNELLLEPEIKKSLVNGDYDGLTKLVDTHGIDIWPVFRYHINHCSLNFSQMLNYSMAIYPGLEKDYHSEVEDFNNQIKQVVNSQDIVLEFSEREKDGYIAIINLCSGKDNRQFILNFYNKTLKFFDNYLADKGNPPDLSVQFFSTVILELEKINISIQRKTLHFPSLERFIQWVKLSSEVDIWKWIAPSINVIEEISSKIQPNAKIPEGVLESIRYIINSKIEVDWSTLIDQCQKHINHNNGTFSNHSDEVFEILALIGLSNPRYVTNLKPIVTSGQFYHLFNQRQTENPLYASVLCGFILNNELRSITIPVIGQSNQGINKIRAFWEIDDSDKAKSVLSYLKPFKQLNFLWQLAEDSKNKLVGHIIDHAIDELDCSFLFEVEDGLNKMVMYQNLKGNQDGIEKLVEVFIQHGKIESEILENKELDVVENCRELCFVIEQTNNMDLIKYVVNLVKPLTKETWFDSLENDSYLTSLAIELHKKSKEFELSHNYLDAIVEFCTNAEKIEEWQEDNWDGLVKLLSTPFQKEFSKEASNHFIYKKGDISDIFYNLAKDYFDKRKILKEENLYEDMVDNSLKEEHYKKLKLINDLFSRDDIKKYYKKDKDKILVIKDRLKDILNKADEDQKQLLKEISDKLDITLKGTES